MFHRFAELPVLASEHVDIALTDSTIVAASKVGHARHISERSWISVTVTRLVIDSIPGQ